MLFFYFTIIICHNILMHIYTYIYLLSLVCIHIFFCNLNNYTCCMNAFFLYILLHVCMYVCVSRNLSAQLLQLYNYALHICINTKFLRFQHIFNTFIHIKNSVSVIRTSPSYRVWRIVVRFSHGCKERQIHFDD